MCDERLKKKMDALVAKGKKTQLKTIVLSYD